MSFHLVIAQSEKPAAKLFGLFTEEKLSTIATHFAGAILILIISWIVAGWTGRLLVRTFEKTDLDETLERFIARTAKWVVMLLGILAALATAGVEVTAFVAIFSTAGLAIGLALQGSLSHVASGVMLLILRPFSVGESVNIAGREGVVDSIDLFTTTIDTLDNRRIIIPNGAVFGAVIENHSVHGRRLCQLKITLRPDADIENARATLLQAAHETIEANIGALATPAPGAVLAEIAHTNAGAGIQHWRVNVWSETKKLPAVQEKLLLTVEHHIRKAQLAAPAPQRVQQV